MQSLKYFTVVVLVATACLGAPTSNDVSELVQEKHENKIVRYEVTQTETGSKFVYELEDGQFRQEEVFVLNKGTDDEEIAVIGSYSFWGTDNQLYVTRYTADRNGYQAKTTHTPRDSFVPKASMEETVMAVETAHVAKTQILADNKL